jgi:hypothetical protein
VASECEWIGVEVVMRTFVGSLVFAGCAVVAAPAGASPVVNNSNNEPSAAGQPAQPLAVQQVRVPVPPVREEVAMVLVGTALIGLAAAVRRAA